MHREDDGVYNIDGWSHRYISFRGERIYENPFPGARINDDEIAVTDLLAHMKQLSLIHIYYDFYRRTCDKRRCGGRSACAGTYGGHGIVSVSYKHLDVYKRQVPDRCCHEQYNEYSGMGGTCIGNSER